MAEATTGGGDALVRGLRMEGDVNTTPLRAAWQHEHLGPQGRAMVDRDAAAYVRQSLSSPCLSALRSCSGPWIEDMDGRRYLDFHGNSVHHIGYGHPKVIEAITKQMSTLSFCPRRFANEPATVLAERLSRLSPGGRRRVLLTPGGASAMGVATKLARIATGRHKTVSLWGAFHGASMEAASIGGESLFRSGLGPLMAGCSHVPPPYPYRCLFGCQGVCVERCAAYLEHVLDAEGDIAAVIAEPIRSTTVLVPPAGFWKRVREACTRRGVLLIFDEIPSGLGRTGDLFASDTVGVDPDILVLGKALGGAVMPLAAVLAKEELDCAPHKALGHYTHEKSPVAAAAANAMLDVVLGDRLAERSRTLGERVMTMRHEASRSLPSLAEVRGRGLLLGVELVRPGTTQPDDDLAERLLYRCLETGLSFKVSAGNVVTLTPPLNIDESLLSGAVEMLLGHLRSLTG